jgi:squalene-associated FAD-dependent desaturase
VTSVAVIGGGLAGISAALRLADVGVQVTLYEGRPKLGGLTHSFRRSDLDVDNGQHVFLRCCTAYQDLLGRLGVADQVTLQDRLDIPVRAPGLTRKARLRRNGLPAPMHLGGSLLRYPLLDTAQRLRFVRAALAMRRLDRTDPAVDARSFGDWLAEHKQDRATIDAMWDLVGIATLNAAADNASLSLAAMVFQVGLLTDPGAADIGWASVPLQRLHGDAAARALEMNGATVSVGAKVDVVEPRERRWLVGAKGGEQLVDAVVMALPPAATERLAPAGSVPLEPGYAAKLGTSPIVNVHVVLDRHVLDTPFVAGVGTPIQWVFDRTVQSGLHDNGRWPRCASGCCPNSSRCCLPWRGPRSWISSSHANARRRFARRPAVARSGHPQRRGHPGSSWPARGPTPVGRRRWRARFAAATPPRRRCSPTSNRN